MQAKIVSSAFSANPFEARAIVEFVPETQSEHDSLAALFGDKMGVVCINRSVNQVLRAEFQLFKPAVVPSAADLDAVAEEEKVKNASSGKPATAGEAAQVNPRSS
jgi:hypothetical protein